MALKQTRRRQAPAYSANALLANIRQSGHSISLWIKTDAVVSGWDYIFAGWFESGYPFGGDANHRARMTYEAVQPILGGGVGYGNVYSNRYDQDGTFVTNSYLVTSDLNLEQWHHFLWVFPAASGTTKLWVDGVVQDGGQDTSDVDFGLFVLGNANVVPATNKDGSSLGACANAQYADLIVFDGELDGTDAAVLYAAGSPGYGRSGTSVAGIADTVLLRCPLQHDVIDLVSGDPVLACQKQFVWSQDDASVFGSTLSTKVIANQNPGVCANSIVGQSPQTLWCLSDSFGSMVPARMLGPLYNRLAYRNFGKVWTANGFLWQVYSTGFTGDSNAVSSANSHRVENETTRTITASSFSSGTETVTYSGPALVVGTAIKIDATYYTIASYTAGSGSGVSQTGAQITFAVASDPGSLIGDEIHVCFIAGLGEGVTSELFDNTGTVWWEVRINDLVAYPSVKNAFQGGALDQVLLDHTRPTTVRIYHRVASDVTQQARSVIIQKALKSGAFATVTTVTGLDNAAHAGQMRLLAEIELDEYPQSTGGMYCGFRILPTATSADNEDRYLFMVGIEIEQDTDGLRIIDLSESSWSAGGLGEEPPGFKQMDDFTINTLVKALGKAEHEHIIMTNMGMEEKTAAQWLTTYNAIKTTWDAAFTAAGLRSPKYMFLGNILHGSGASAGTVSLAEWRSVFEAQNIGAMNFAKAHPTVAEFASLYLESDGVAVLPYETEVGVNSPGCFKDGQGQIFYDYRLYPDMLAVVDATWTEGTLAITKAGAFTYFTPRVGGYVYVAQTALAGTPVVPGWYTITGCTANTITVSTSITGGSAGVGADVAVLGIAAQGIALHPSPANALIQADLLANRLEKSARTSLPVEELIADLEINIDAPTTAQIVAAINASTTGTNATTAATQATAAAASAAAAPASTVAALKADADFGTAGLLLDANLAAAQTNIDADGFDLEETARLLLAALAGKATATSTSFAARAADDSKTRITAVTTADGSRTTVTLDAS